MLSACLPLPVHTHTHGLSRRRAPPSFLLPGSERVSRAPALVLVERVLVSARRSHSQCVRFGTWKFFLFLESTISDLNFSLLFIDLTVDSS